MEEQNNEQNNSTSISPMTILLYIGASTFYAITAISPYFIVESNSEFEKDIKINAAEESLLLGTIMLILGIISNLHDKEVINKSIENCLSNNHYSLDSNNILSEETNDNNEPNLIGDSAL